MDDLTRGYHLPVGSGSAPSKDEHARAPRIAFVHEWLITYAGSEKVLKAMLDEFPDADLFSLIDFLKPDDRVQFGARWARTTFMQRIPLVRRIYPYLLLLMPFAVESHDVSRYDIVISNSHAVAKGVLTTARQLHLCYCYSPMRYAWDLETQYLSESGMSRGVMKFVAKMTMHIMRGWDLRSSFNVDEYIACSGYIAERIRRVYRRDAAVVYPNVAVDEFTLGQDREEFYLTASRLTPYKRVDLIIEAFSKMPDRRLIVIGEGKQFRRLSRMAPPNVTMMGYQSFEVLRDHMRKAKAFLFAAEEDFGITPIEAQACGTPVLAYVGGGASETVVHGKTGLLFEEQSAAAIQDCVDAFERGAARFDAAEIRDHALGFATERFRSEFRQHVEEAWQAHERRRRDRQQPHARFEPTTVRSLV